MNCCAIIKLGDNSMGDKESLRQYLSYANDGNTVVGVFSQLDQQLKLLHQAGYYVPTINSDTIIREEDVFVFNVIAKFDNREDNISSNVVSLAKLAVGAFAASGNDFYDYTYLDTAYLKESFKDIEFIFPEEDGVGEYYKKVIVEGITNEYLSDHIALSQGGNAVGNSRTFVKTTPAGIALSGRSDDAGFVRIVFYPIMIALILTFVYVVVNIV